ncbi:MAG: transposase, partial [Clostridia bacterium]|nr:transposase [Clostridia bacterium]
IPERSIRESTLRTKSKRSILSKVIGYLKMNTTKEIHKTGYNGIVFQRSYYDHILRGKDDYNEIYEYIENNPTKWILTKNA